MLKPLIVTIGAMAALMTTSTMAQLQPLSDAKNLSCAAVRLTPYGACMPYELDTIKIYDNNKTKLPKKIKKNTQLDGSTQLQPVVNKAAPTQQAPLQQIR